VFSPEKKESKTVEPHRVFRVQPIMNETCLFNGIYFNANDLQAHKWKEGDFVSLSAIRKEEPTTTESTTNEEKGSPQPKQPLGQRVCADWEMIC
jgi:hypothetical protein